VGHAGVSALAGYGAGARLEFILVPLCYGIGGPAGIMIGTNIGAGQARRALRTAWVTVLLTACMAEAIGVAFAIWPEFWMRAFSADPAVIATGVAYLKTVGPFFGFFGMGYALYCVGQGAKRMEWPVLGAVTRAAIAVVGGFASVHIVIALDHIFVAVSLGMLSFGCLSLPGLASRQGFGATGHPSKQDSVADNTETRDLANAAEVCPASASLR
jgi:Na+-driven multidrug efflux pump